MSIYNDKQQREVFHLLFLERLLNASDPRLYALKGGVNLRFYFKSPRYSEDMDLDALGGNVETLKKSGYKILEDRSFRRVLRSYGVEDLITSDKEKAKHTKTTQRFRVNLINSAGEQFPTKVEFSRRTPTEQPIYEVIDPQIVRPYQRMSFKCQHYDASSILKQKIRALANRSETQARDPFDIYVLWLGGHISAEPLQDISSDDKSKALNNLSSIAYENYLGQVVEFIEPEERKRFSGKDTWDDIENLLLKLLN